MDDDAALPLDAPRTNMDENAITIAMVIVVTMFFRACLDITVSATLIPW